MRKRLDFGAVLEPCADDVQPPSPSPIRETLAAHLGVISRDEVMRPPHHACDEIGCGQLTGAIGDASLVEVDVRQSAIQGAGMGLFACGSISRGTNIGFFSGKLMCARCVVSTGLHKGPDSFCVVECGSTYNQADEEVLWYLYRYIGRHEINDCKVWFLNSSTSSSSRRRRRRRSQGGNPKEKTATLKANCYILCEGFAGFGIPFVSVSTLRNIKRDEELLLDYMLDE
jgi:hypothetical protein